LQRHAIAPRSDWTATVEALGFDWHSVANDPSGEPNGIYWDESAYWHLTSDEVDVLEEATNTLHGMCLAAAEQAIARGLLPHFGFDKTAIALIEESWKRRDDDQFSLYGRFDLAFAGGDSPPKMLEYNADTPTGLFEAAVVQWTWLEERFPDSDQFNSLHEALVAAWGKVAPALGPERALHFTCLAPHAEDEGTLRYMLDTALEAGLAGKTVSAANIGWSTEADSFVDLDNLPMAALFKIIPWDWMLADEFGPQLARLVAQRRMTVIEPAWKMVISNKAILALLWEMYPDHPNLLPAYMERRAFAPGTTVVAKPLLGREGANISIAVLGEGGALAGDPIATMGGNYGDEGYVYQALGTLASATDEGGRTHNAVIGSWVINGNSHGIGIREDESLITHNRSRFVPHLFS
jgi:glutathionylspermidine synthase